jgi:hypothetical protein
MKYLLPLAALSLVACGPVEDEAPSSLQTRSSAICNECPPPDHAWFWKCTPPRFGVFTMVREMRGSTRFECGPFTCGDSSHSQPTSVVDIVGGIDMICHDDSESFHGPLNGEWNGCTDTDQIDSGQHYIKGSEGNYSMYPHSWDVWERWDRDISSVTGSTDYMNNPYVSVYDLDTCINKQIIGSIYYGNFPVTAQLLEGNPSSSGTHAKWLLEGNPGVRCATPANGCESVVCSDFLVQATYTCDWGYWPTQNEP